MKKRLKIRTFSQQKIKNLLTVWKMNINFDIMRSVSTDNIVCIKILEKYK